MQIDRAFWAGRRVLLTGHTGFKGGWLSLWLQDMGAQVVGYALPPAGVPSLFEVADVARGMVSVFDDVRDAAAVADVCERYRPELVIHMAAQPLVRYSYQQPVETYATNVMGTLNVLEAVRQVEGVRVLINVTSDKCYANREWVWGYREDEPLGGHDPYSSSKACAELVTAAYRESYFPPGQYERHGLGIATGRAGNVIGGGDWAEDRLIPDILRALDAGRPVELRRPHATRPWQHVLEPLAGYLLLAEHLWKRGPAFAGAWNFGPSDQDARPVAWVAARLVSLLDREEAWSIQPGEHPHEAEELRLDCSKARRGLGYHPKLALETALEWVAQWHRACRERADMREVTLGQIRRYEELPVQ